MKLKMCAPESFKFSEKLKIKYTVLYVILGDLVWLLQFRKREKHPWMSATFSKVEANAS